jgi:hypothetical protein
MNGLAKLQMHLDSAIPNLTNRTANRAYNSGRMRRLMAIAAFALLVAVPVWAQHGGGGHGGGGHAGGFGGGHSGGFSGGHAGFSGGHTGFSGGHSGYSSSGSFGAHAYSGPRSQAVTRGFSTVPSSRFTTRAFSNRPFLHDGFRGAGFRNGFHNFNRFGFRNGCSWYGCRYYGGYPWWGYGGYWDPWWWWNSDSDYDQDYYNNLAAAQQMDEQSLEEQQMLRQEDADGDQDAYNQNAYRQPAPRQQAPAEKDGAAFMPATILVFRDQHRREVDNYAIVGQTIWVFAPKQAERIPLSQLDVDATVKANEDRGVTFRLPIASEGQ